MYLKGEYLIKDSHPDVYQILGVEAKATITNKETLADKINDRRSNKLFCYVFIRG